MNSKNGIQLVEYRKFFLMMHFYSMCNLESDTDRRICLLDDNSTFAEYFKIWNILQNEVLSNDFI